MFLRTPLAWFELIHNKVRFATSVLGAAFAVFLMFIEVGFLNGVYDSQTDLLSKLNADLFMVNRLKVDFLPVQSFSRRRLIQALSNDGVAAAFPLYFEEFRSHWKNFDDGGRHIVLAIGFNPEHPAFLLPEVLEHRKRLRMPDTAIFDSRSRSLYGGLSEGSFAELTDRRIQLVGTFEIGPNFRSDGMLIMSDTNFLRFFADADSGRRDPDRIEMGLLKLAPGYEAIAVRQELQAGLGDEVQVLTHDELAGRIRDYWKTFQPIGAIFGVGAVIGFVIGVAICYQILFNDITDNLAQLATLKAIGYPQWFLVKVVMQKAVLLSVGGFLPGMLMSVSLYSYLESWTGIRMWLTAGRGLTVFALTVAMCILAGLLAVHKVSRADPADLY